jgi:ABC-type transport system involved in multi-copper enzyme maturation permease subunit
MLSILIQKELKNILLSPKFVATFLVCSLLILISVFIGINEYKNAQNQYQANQEIARQNIAEASNWGRVRNIVHREPIPMQIFVSGLHFDVGRLSNISTFDDIKLIRSPYSDETIFAIFRFIDFAFIVQVVLSLFAILFTYDAINGERENGTLKLAFANPISRVQYLLAKFAGIWLGLVIPLLIPILIGLLLLVLMRVPLNPADWISIGAMVVLSILFITLFIGIGIFVSSITRNSSLSFLLLLVIWIGGVFILPRMGVMAAGQLVPVESIAQLEAKQEAFQKARWDQYSSELSEAWQQRESQMEGMTENERSAYRDEKEWEWLEEDDATRKQVQADIIENNRTLLEETQNRKKVQEKLAFTIARISPVSSFRLAAMNLAGTDINLKNRYEEAMRGYKDDFTDFVESRQESEGGGHGMRIEMDSETGVQIDFGRNDQTLDTSELPRFSAPIVEAGVSLGSSLLDFGLLLMFIILSFGGSFMAFLRYDMR